MSNESPEYIDCTKRLMKALPGDEELLMLVQTGIKFCQQRRGKSPGFLHNYITDIVSEMPNPTFKCLLSELEFEAARRSLYDEDESPIEKVDRVWELMTYHHPRKGRTQIPFSTLRNYLTKAKKEIHSQA